MVEICKMEVPRKKLLECPPCTEIFFERIGRVNFGRVTIAVIRRYVVRKCYLGLALGQHVHSLTLLPTEEVEIEVVRRSKFSRALHEQRSVESEFRQELQNTSRDEWSSEEESNFKVSVDAGFKIFGIGTKTKGEYSGREKTAEKHFREIINKTTSKVSQKYEIAVDTSTQVENQYRSVRKIKNPNPCQPVIYHFFQLAKKYKTELILTDIRFDFVSQPPPIFAGRLSTFAIAAESPYRQNLNLQITAPPPAWTLAAAETSPTATPTHAASLQFAPLSTFAQFALSQSTLGQTAQLAGLPALQAPTELPDVMQLTDEELLQKISGAGVDEAAFNRKDFEAFLKDEVNKLGVKDTYDYCINTDGLYVEANVSECPACDQATLELRRLEVEKARVELELLRRQSLAGESSDEEPT